ncbi:hypothetical protein PG996_015055 [Apiospora saccharicola]|uniref:Uncharacterized protein n=1 Tax=Apiospora saccharicola TaxID=335842 RepID=A0ABR1TK19_9PEZI
MAATSCSCKNKCSLSFLNATDQLAAAAFCQSIALSPITALSQLPTFASPCATFKDFAAQAGHGCACLQKQSASASSTCSYLTPTAGGATCMATTATVYVTSAASCSASSTPAAISTITVSATGAPVLSICPTPETITQTSTAVLGSTTTQTVTATSTCPTVAADAGTSTCPTAAAVTATVTNTPQRLSCLQEILNGNFEEGPPDSDIASDRTYPWVGFLSSDGNDINGVYNGVLRAAPGAGRGGSTAAAASFILDTMPGPESRYSVGMEQFVPGCQGQPGFGYQIVGYFKPSDTSLALAVDFSGCQRLGSCDTTKYVPALGPPDADGFQYFETPIYRPRSFSSSILITLRSSPVPGAGVPYEYQILFDDISMKVYNGADRLVNIG